jgi:class 3 adenylate cyclase
MGRPRLRLVAVCSHCGRRNADDARFCSGCAAPLVAQPAAPPAVRKTVTVLFGDMVDSTPLGERLDPEPLRRVQRLWHESVRVGATRRHGRERKRSTPSSNGTTASKFNCGQVSTPELWSPEMGKR